MSKKPLKAIEIPAPEDARWDDVAWRVRQFKKLFELEYVTTDIAKSVLSCEAQSIWNMKSGNPRNAITRNNLLLLFYYLNAETTA